LPVNLTQPDLLENSVFLLVQSVFFYRHNNLRYFHKVQEATVAVAIAMM